MSELWRVAAGYRPEHKRLTGKLTFDLGQIFLARIAGEGDSPEELLLKLLDGWKIPAKLDKPMKEFPTGLLKFQVEGFEDGKLIIKLLSKEMEEQLPQNSLEAFLKEQDMGIEKKDVSLLFQMLKNNMPLTRENLTKVKTLLDLKERIENQPNSEEEFIDNYLRNKGVYEEKEALEIIGNLKSFFKELKELSRGEILTLMESNVDITTENMVSFKRVFKETQGLENTLRDMMALVEKDEISPKEIEFLKANEQYNAKPVDNANKDGYKIAAPEVDNKETWDLIALKAQESYGEDSILLKGIKEDTSLKHSDIDAKGNEAATDKSIKSAEEKPAQQPNAVREDALAKEFVRKSVSAIKIMQGKVLSDEGIKIIKEEIFSRVEEVKTLIKNLSGENFTGKTEVLAKVLEGIRQYVNDIKVFNTLSQQYYYMDVPLHLPQGKYDCKLIIKDERGKGKRIDSSNVKMVVNVKTMNMGVVDSYIKVMANNLSIDIRCEEPWVRLIDSKKEDIFNLLKGGIYNTYITIGKKKQEATLGNLSDFFNDPDISTIDVKV